LKPPTVANEKGDRAKAWSPPFLFLTLSSMNLRSPRLLVLGGAFFVVGAFLLLVWLAGHARGFLVAGLGLVCLSVPVLALGGRWIQGSQDPLEARRERRLWRSGPLGRQWLGKRKRLP